MMCRVLQVSRSGYFAWAQRVESARRQRDRELLLQIRRVHLESRGVYGARKVHRELLRLGEACGRHRVARLMRQDGLKGCPKRRFRRLASTAPSHPIAANLLQQDFTARRANERWAADITFIATRQGWLYLAVVMDLYSRRIVGWAMDREVGRRLVIAALTMALGYRQPAGPLLHHSDRGPQYTSDDFRELLARHGIRCSMSGRGSCWSRASSRYSSESGSGGRRTVLERRPRPTCLITSSGSTIGAAAIPISTISRQWSTKTGWQGLNQLVRNIGAEPNGQKRTSQKQFDHPVGASRQVLPDSDRSRTVLDHLSPRFTCASPTVRPIVVLGFTAAVRVVYCVQTILKGKPALPISRALPLSRFPFFRVPRSSQLKR